MTCITPEGGPEGEEGREKKRKKLRKEHEHWEEEEAWRGEKRSEEEMHASK